MFRKELSIKEVKSTEVIVAMKFRSPNDQIIRSRYILDLEDDFRDIREELESRLYCDLEEAILLDSSESLNGMDITSWFFDDESRAIDENIVQFGNTCDYSGICEGPTCPDYQYCILQ